MNKQQAYEKAVLLIKKLDGCSSRYPFVSKTVHARNIDRSRAINAQIDFIKNSNPGALDKAWEDCISGEK